MLGLAPEATSTALCSYWCVFQEKKGVSTSEWIVPPSPPETQQSLPMRSWLPWGAPPCGNGCEYSFMNSQTFVEHLLCASPCMLVGVISPSRVQKPFSHQCIVALQSSTLHNNTLVLSISFLSTGRTEIKLKCSPWRSSNEKEGWEMPRQATARR